MSELSFLSQATAGFSTAAVILQTVIVMQMHNMNERLRNLIINVKKLNTRVQTLSTKAGLGELDIGE